MAFTLFGFALQHLHGECALPFAHAEGSQCFFVRVCSQDWQSVASTKSLGTSLRQRGQATTAIYYEQKLTGLGIANPKTLNPS